MQYSNVNFPDSCSMVHSFMRQRKAIGRTTFLTSELQQLVQMLAKYLFVQIHQHNIKRLSIMEALSLSLAATTKQLQRRAFMLDVSKGTLRTYEKRAMTKLGADSLIQAVGLAVQEKMIEII